MLEETEAQKTLEEMAENDQPTESQESRVESPGQPAEGPESGAESLEQESAEEEEDAKLRQWFDETHGLKVGQNFKTDEEFLASAAEAFRAMGKRNDDALLGKQIRQVYDGQDETLREILSGKLPAKQDGKAPSVDEWNPAWMVLDKDGRMMPAAGAPADVEERFRRRILQMANDPTQFMQTPIRELQQRLEQMQQDTAQYQEATALEAWAEANRKLLFIDGDPNRGLTAQGRQIVELEQELAKEPPTHLNRLERAAQFVLAGQVRPAKSRKMPARAMRQASPAQPASDDTTIEQLIEEGMGLAQAHEEIMRRQAASVGV